MKNENEKPNFVVIGAGIGKAMLAIQSVGRAARVASERVPVLVHAWNETLDWRRLVARKNGLKSWRLVMDKATARKLGRNRITVRHEGFVSINTDKVFKRPRIIVVDDYNIVSDTHKIYAYPEGNPGAKTKIFDSNENT